MKWAIPGLAILGFPSAVLSHHSVAGFFDPTQTRELEGVITSTVWRNPHTVFELEVPDDSGSVTTWRIETGALGVLRARGLDRNFLHVGDQVKIMGDVSLRGRSEIFARNLLLSNGREVMLTVGSRPYFSSQGEGELLESVYDDETVAAARRSAHGIFRVWSTNIEELPPSGARMFDGDYPLTASASAKRAEWDPGNEVLLGCTEWNMPRLMANPLPMAFVDEGNVIRLKFEEDDNERLIYMAGTQDVGPDERTLLGHSTGRWDGETLVVETTGIQAGVIDDHGTPFSAQIHLLERFSVSEDGSRLEYQIAISDPESFLETVSAERYWIWRPEIVVGRYACEEEQALE